jgi:PTS system nitrogen regulatory IIA component
LNLSVRDIGRLLGVPEETVYRWLKEGAIPAYRIQDQYRFDRAEILEWATAKGLALSPRLFDEPVPGGATPTQGRLAAALAAGGIHYDVGGEDRPSALRSVVDLLPLPPEADRGFLLEMLLAREELGSTALGRGIAIPHPRFPVILPPSPEILALCFLTRPIDFHAPDGEPVGTLFLLVSSGVKGHLALLSRLAFVLKDAAALDLLERRAGRETLLEAFALVERAMDAGS